MHRRAMSPGSLYGPHRYSDHKGLLMRKLFSFMMATVDGYYEGPDQEFDFWVVDDELDEFSVAQLDEVDTLVFGRVTYQGMAAYWPTPAANEDEPAAPEPATTGS
jgi:dihydrofolate reductase